MMDAVEDNESTDSKKDTRTDDLDVTVTDSAVNGLLDNFKLELTHVSQEIRSLTDKQNELLEKVEEHNTVIQNGPELAQLVKVMEEMKIGMDRLSKLRHEMTIVHDRSEKLKNRAGKLEAFCKTAQKKEDDLVAKMDKVETKPCED